jgi:hypothetical protein
MDGERTVTEQEGFVSMLNRAGIHWTDSGNPSTVEIEAKTGPRNDGYFGFSATFYFTKAGLLERVGIWE